MMLKLPWESNRLKEILILIFTSFASTLLILIYFNIFKPSNFETHHPHGTNEVLERNYDSPIYIIIAKTWYDISKIEQLNFNNLPPSYFPNHFPLYPAIIKLFSFLGMNNFLASVIITWTSSALFTVVFYLFLHRYRLSSNPFKLSLISLFLPPRWLAIRSVPGTEPIFCLFVILALIFWLEKKYHLTSIMLVLLVLTRPPGIIFLLGFLAIMIYENLQSNDKKAHLLQSLKSKWGLIFAPLTLAGLFYFYQLKFGDFFAYFHTGTGTNVHLKLFPFAFVTQNNSPMVEGYFYLFFIYTIAIYLLWKRQRQIAIFCAVYLLPNFFMIVDDLYRYLIPISAFLLIPFAKYFDHKLFKYIFPIFLVGIYIYTLSILPLRMFPYDDYSRLRLHP